MASSSARTDAPSTATQSESKTASESPLEPNIKDSLRLDNSVNELNLSPLATAESSDEKSSVSVRLLFSRQRSFDADETLPHRRALAKPPKSPINVHPLRKFLANVWGIVRIGCRLCYVLCPPVPHCIMRKALYHPPNRLEYYYFVADNRSERSIKVTSAKKLAECNNARLHLPNLNKGLINVINANHMERIECLTVKTSRGDHLAVFVVHCLASWVLGTRSPRVILYSQPNSSDLGSCLIGQPTLIEIADFLSCDLVAYDYSGYGLSTGKPSERSLYADIDAVFAKTTGDLGYSPSDVVLFGYSLGTAVSIDLAARQPKLAGVVLLAPFASVLRFLTAIDKQTLCIDQFASVDKVSRIVAPTLICHGTKDEVVSVMHGRALYEKLQNPVSPLWALGATHESIYTHCAHTWRRIKLFIDKQIACAPQ